MVGSVGDGQIALRLQAVGEKIVDHTAPLVAQHAVLRAADRDLRDVVGEQSLQQGLGLRAGGFDLAHV